MTTVDDRASSSTAYGSTYEVYLSFSRDTRLNFTDHLYHYLIDVGVQTFKGQDENCLVGKEIGSQLLEAIEKSTISIPIFSREYATSSWCLRELTQMVKCKESNPGHTICPIFYDVTQSDVMHQTGSFHRAFIRHKEKLDPEIVQEWRDALREVCRLRGLEKDKIGNGHEAEFMKVVVAHVCRILEENDAVKMTTKGEPWESSIQADQAEDKSSEWATIHETLKKFKKEAKVKPSKTRIRKVPRLLLDTVDNREKYFKPKVLFLGPFHWEFERNYEESMQLKLKAASLFMDAKNDRDMEKWKKAYNEIRGKVYQFMELYALQTMETQNFREVARMFFLDGCAAMYFISGAINVAKSGIKTHELVLAQQDLLMLENQLPFELLELLTRLKFPHLKEKNWYMEQFIGDHIPKRSIGRVVRKDEDHHVHLLHFMRTRLQEATSSNKNQNFVQATIHTSLPYSCRSAVQLNKRGISFRASPSRGKEQVDFDDHSLSGVLYLPSINIDDLSKGKLLNLVADEMSSDVPNKSEIASYLCFLDSLIDDAEDVKILRESNIIRNGLGSDQELANLFNEITENLVPDNRVYKGVMAAIQSHFDNKTKTWMAQLYDDYFRTPWALIAFSAAILVISLNLNQTYLTLVPPASEERNQWKRLWHIVKHMYMPIVLALPMTFLLLIILLVPLVGIYMYGFPSKYKKQGLGHIQRVGKHGPEP